MRIGAYELSAIETGTFRLDGGAMFGVVPKALWQRHAAADADNRVELASRALLILVDTGLGQKWNARQAEQYALEPGGLERSLAARGLRTGDITDVLLTHLHFDHAGGATRHDGDRIVPTFANARYWVQARNLAQARSPSEKDRASYRPDDFEALVQGGVLELLDGGGEWLPGIELILSEGHTTAMQMPHVFDDQGRHLVYCADLIPTVAHVPVPWVMAYDLRPLETIAEKRALLERAHAEDWIVLFEHDRVGPAARIVAADGRFAAGDRVAL
jgi:glyoxylase-like metal-dependent hydrolase (beta-lactamase superfamily II)